MKQKCLKTKKKELKLTTLGFTLIELLAVIIILSVIISIIVISVNSILNDSKSSLSDTQKRNLEKIAETYYLEEGMSENVSCVNVSDLISKGYVDSSEVKDPNTREDIGGSVKIIYDSNQYTYKYQKEVCE